MSDQLSSADSAWLRMDRPTNLMVINSVLGFDEPVDWDRVTEIVRLRLVERYPRFRQRVVESRLPLRAPHWEDDPDWRLEHHLHRVALPDPGDRATLQAFVGDQMTMPLHHSRPLWHMHFVDNYGQGAAIVVRMHHCIADGIALAQVLLGLTDEDPAGDLALPDRSGGGGLSSLLTTPIRLGATVVRQGAQIVSSPEHGVRLAGELGRTAATAVRLLLTPADAATMFKHDPGISRRVAWTSPLSLPAIKQIAKKHKATVNDVVLAGVSGALRHYLQDRGEPVAEISAMVPFNLRPLDEPVPRNLGNRFGLVFLPLPVGTSGSFKRLSEVNRRMREIKESRDGAVSYAMLSATGIAPEQLQRRVIDIFTGKGTAVMTNVPGPRTPVTLAGTPIRTILVWAPTSGHIGMSVSIFSYRGEVTVGLMVDAALVERPQEIVDRVEEELALLNDAAGPAPGGDQLSLATA